MESLNERLKTMGIDLRIGQHMQRLKTPTLTILKAQKVIVTGDIIEVYTYDKATITCGGNTGVRKGEGVNQVKNYAARQKERRDSVRRLITMNFTTMDKFITLTFRDNEMKDILEANSYFEKYVKRMKRRYPDFQYVAVIEFQDTNDRGTVHYHMICNLPYVPQKELLKIWGQGWVYINAIDKVDNLGAYVIKYMTSDTADERLKGKKAYLYSRGLKKPEEIKTWDGEKQREETESIKKRLKGKEPVYTSSFTNEYCGNITYQQYNLKRHHNDTMK